MEIKEQPQDLDVSVLREAAALMRGQHGRSHPRYRFWHALAGVLDDLANREVLLLRSPGSLDLERAVQMARAYLDAAG